MITQSKTDSTNFYSLHCTCILGIILLLSSCSKNNKANQIEVITGNVAYNNFIPSEGDNYFVLDQNKIRFLNTSAPRNLSISSSFPFTDTYFEVVRGNTDTMYIQQADGLHIYLRKTEGNASWEEQAIIRDVLPCDKFNVRYPFLLTSVGNTPCNYAASPTELRLYEITNLAVPKLRSTTGSVPILKIEPSMTPASFYVASADGRINQISVSIDSTASTTNILTEAALRDFTASGEKLITRSKASISQYEVAAGKSATLLSKIPISQ